MESLSYSGRCHRLELQSKAMDYKQYEQVASDIVRSIFEYAEGVVPEQVKYGSKNRWPGVSGYKHQIDVSVVGSQDLILVECKCWGDTIPVEECLVFLARVHDIKPTFNGKIHAVMVTTVGFQSGVKKLAEYYEIELAVVKSASEFVLKYKDLLSVGWTEGVKLGAKFSAGVSKSQGS